MKWSEQLGAKLQTKDGLQDTDDKLAGKKVIGFYFSAHWCPPCRQFTPFLSALYIDMIKKHPEFELVYVSLDRDLIEYNKHLEDITFPAIPFNERTIIQALNTKFGVTRIPMLVYVDGEDKVMTSLRKISQK